jgi:AraC-like DNA-binding protein
LSCDPQPDAPSVPGGEGPAFAEDLPEITRHRKLFILEVSRRLYFLAHRFSDMASDISMESLTYDPERRLILRALNCLIKHSEMKKEPNKQEPGLENIRILNVRKMIDEKCCEKIAIADMAKVAGMSTHHFCSTFHATVGVTPHRYQLERRIDKAKDLLRGSERLIDIALVCGFTSQQHFTTVFRKITGTTPLLWKKTNL